MSQNIFRNQLIELVNHIRAYGMRMLEGLSANEMAWFPEGTRGRTISSYLRHIINAELYWLKQLGYQEIPDYLPKESSNDELMKNYRSLSTFICDLIGNASEEDLIPHISPEKRTLAWMVWRTSLHAIHHFAQVAYIRYTIENPPNAKSIDSSWGDTIDILVFLGYFKELNMS
ncbi:MAG: DinB family protein [Candidatus Hodarchaeota archaeon]